MAYGIALTFDSNLESQIRKVWHAFQDAGIGKTPGQFDEPPHVGLVGCPNGSPTTLSDMIDEIRVSDAGIKLIPFGVFLGPKYVVYYNALLSEDLLKAHKELYSFLNDHRITFDPLYSPGQVLFHCTVAVDIESAHYSKAISIMRDCSEPMAGTATRIQLFEYFPIKKLHTRNLSSIQS